MDFHRAVRCSLSPDLPRCPDRGNELQSTAPSVHTTLSRSEMVEQVLSQHSCYCQPWQAWMAATATVAGFQRNCSVHKDVLHSQTENLPSSSPWLQTKAANPKSTGFRRVEGKAEARVLPVLEKFRIKGMVLVQLHSAQSPGDPSA